MFCQKGAKHCCFRLKVAPPPVLRSVLWFFFGGGRAFLAALCVFLLFFGLGEPNIVLGCCIVFFFLGFYTIKLAVRRVHAFI